MVRSQARPSVTQAGVSYGSLAGCACSPRPCRKPCNHGADGRGQAGPFSRHFRLPMLAFAVECRVLRRRRSGGRSIGNSPKKSCNSMEQKLQEIRDNLLILLNRGGPAGTANFALRRAFFWAGRDGQAGPCRRRWQGGCSLAPCRGFARARLAAASPTSCRPGARE